MAKMQAIATTTLGLTMSIHHSTPMFHLIRHLAAENANEQKATYNSMVERLMGESTAVFMRKTTEDHGGVHLPAGWERDLTVSFGALSGGNLVGTKQVGFLDVLQAESKLMQMGATLLTDLTENADLGTGTGAPSSFWVDENASGTEADFTFGKAQMKPKSCIAYADISRKLLRTSAPDMEALVLRNLVASITAGLERAAIAGTGGNQPLGLLNNLIGMGAVAIGTNGGAWQWQHAVDLEFAVAGPTGARTEGLAFLSNPIIRRNARKNSGSDADVWGRMSDIAPTFVSTHVPSNLTKGSGAGLSAVIYGRWADLLIAMFGGIEILVDQRTSLAGMVRVLVFMEADTAIARPGSFAVCIDAQ